MIDKGICDKGFIWDPSNCDGDKSNDVREYLDYANRKGISEGIDVNKTNASKECDICHYWYSKDIGFKYEPYFCNGYHGLI